jgi:hypothetical protein
MIFGSGFLAKRGHLCQQCIAINRWLCSVNVLGRTITLSTLDNAGKGERVLCYGRRFARESDTVRLKLEHSVFNNCSPSFVAAEHSLFNDALLCTCVRVRVSVSMCACACARVRLRGRTGLLLRPCDVRPMMVVIFDEDAFYSESEVRDSSPL